MTALPKGFFIITGPEDCIYLKRFFTICAIIYVWKPLKLRESDFFVLKKFVDILHYIFTILQHCFQKLRATDVATIHCSAHITPAHVLQKLSQVCMLISTTTGRAYRPRNSERLVLYFKDLNLAAPDKWGTSMLISFLQQILTYKGFYDDNLEWVGLEQVHVVASLVGGIDAGRHPLSPRFTSVIRIHSIRYLNKICLSKFKTIFF
ncbi:cytoplasmic dynein 2 heavy chain 1-like [Schistocerca piceifrons]|uniref:cytoplasmic dynein 2 heavy chain 1-like n=1 Tax=Schistocerca piceifrons TaxID=274613 RepID=UPI001F5F3D09|nr:cytoplasmic dynein 2 heavy chain 1-like [Schistocerca piceifrons]